LDIGADLAAADEPILAERIAGAGKWIGPDELAKPPPTLPPI